ncbi:MAG: hypothetical protein JRG80_20215 [Deltaproteobacteria bacterium]|nr:hypothetical protein [Deltaproteobacteria bacterium]MBW2401549.1 hypothetical protein [Deltaproteobacteria bacterium]MBW2666083.1 hypothetical protein [Deltaproteobacteria bacterium]
MMDGSTCDLPPHVVRVHTEHRTAFNQTVEGTLTLRDSPWDPIKELLPIESEVLARRTRSRRAWMAALCIYAPTNPGSPA